MCRRLPGLQIFAVIWGLTAAIHGAAACDSVSLLGLLDRVNAIREENDLGPVAADTALTEAAKGHAIHLAQSGTLDHIGSDGADPGTRARAVGYDYGLVVENLAAGTNDAASVLDSWLVSPGHRGNLLQAQARDAGLACVRNAWVLMLASPRE